MKYTSTVCALCRQILRPIVRHKILPDGPTSGSWSILLSLGTTRVLTLTLSTWTTGSILKMYALRGIIVFRYCGYIFGYALRVRYCSYSHYEQYLVLLTMVPRNSWRVHPFRSAVYVHAKLALIQSVLSSQWECGPKGLQGSSRADHGSTQYLRNPFCPSVSSANQTRNGQGGAKSTHPKVLDWSLYAINSKHRKVKRMPKLTAPS